MKRSTFIGLVLGSLTLLGSLSTTLPAHAQTQLTLRTYAAKFVCGKSDQKIASPGLYFTMINVHNPSPFKRAVYIKRFAIALPDERPGKISNFFGGILGPDEAMTIDCENIYKHTQVPSGQFLDGFALIYALDELDVVSVYTAGHSEVETVHTERVPVRRLVIPRTNAVSRRLLQQENLE
jgi:hypothetical protein